MKSERDNNIMNVEDVLQDVEIGEEVDNQPPERDRKYCKRTLLIALIVSAVAALGLGLGLGLKGASSSSVADESTQQSQTSHVTPYLSPPEEPTGDTSDDKESASLENEEAEVYYRSPPTDPIPATLRLISPSIMSGYAAGEEGCNELYSDIYNAAAILANEEIKENAEDYDYRYSGGYGCRSYSYSSFSGGVPKSLNRAPDSGSVTEDSYETNNQEGGVDEADVMKSDGKHVFTGYGDILVIWDAKTGEELSRTRIPPRKALAKEEGGYQSYYNRMPSISGLLLDSNSNRIVVIASGYGQKYRFDYPGRPVLGDKGEVQVRVYDITKIPTDGSELPLIASKELDGRYRAAREIDGVAHIVVQSSVETHSHISRALDYKRDMYDGLNRDKYIAAATEKAKEVLHRFSTQMVEELVTNSGGKDCSAVIRVALYASGGADVNRDGLPDTITSGGILRSYIQTFSFDISAGHDTESLGLDTKAAGSFFPSGSSEVYASKDVIIAAGRGYHRHPEGSWSQSTYFLAYKLQADGSAPSGLSIGSAPGYVLNQFSMDEYKGYFRVATTERARWACVESSEPSVWRSSWTRCKWRRVSESKSQLVVMKFPESGTSEYSGEMKTIKVIRDLGVTEEIKSARFFDDKAYIVTFRQTDPLYTIDFKDPENPEVTDELKITGFSSYLHPVGNDRLLAIGKEADEKTGRVTGFQITLFDVSNLKNTKVLQRYTLDNDKGWMSSSAENDHLAFRYLPQSKLLILPVRRTTYWSSKKDPFDGFKIYYVDDDGIEKRFGIEMTSPSKIRKGCWYRASLPARSMVFKGNLTVVKGHGYASYDLNTEMRRWKHNLDKNLPKNKCANYW